MITPRFLTVFYPHDVKVQEESDPISMTSEFFKDFFSNSARATGIAVDGPALSTQVASLVLSRVVGTIRYAAGQHAVWPLSVTSLDDKPSGLVPSRTWD